MTSLSYGASFQILVIGKTYKNVFSINVLSYSFAANYHLNPVPPGLFKGGAAWGGGGGGRKVPAAYNSKTINDNEMKFAGVVKDH